MEKYVLALLTAISTLVACVKEDGPSVSRPAMPRGISFGLRHDGYSAGIMHAVKRRDEASVDDNEGVGPADYDKVVLEIMDMDGNAVGDWKGKYDRNTSTVLIEGLHPGDYRLLVLGIQGDSGEDGAVIMDLEHISDAWLTFSEDNSGPLAAEYFYSSTPFSVYYEENGSGKYPVADIPSEVVQSRIVSRLDFNLNYRNKYVRTSVSSNNAVIEDLRTYTSLAGDGAFSGENVRDMTLDLTEGQSFIFMPVTAEFNGEVLMDSRDYRGNSISRSYAFDGVELAPNTISAIDVDVAHPEDDSGTMFITATAYAEGAHSLILQDDEPHGIYTDKTLRNFNTAKPLQLSVTDGGSLAARFYSPRSIRNVLVRARIPSVHDEFIDIAYFDEIPAFADFSELLPAVGKSAFYRTETGRIVEIGKLEPSQFSEAEFMVVSDDPYWTRLQEIRHGWNIRFDLYGGDPTQPDGGPQGNWMGIRPVHCREAVAFFLNFTYMIDMPEHEQILRENQDRLYGNGGVDDKVTVETVLAQMRQTRTINVGLVYTGNNVMGLGGGSTFGAWQGGWVEHYTSLYACEVMFHELGHVMGYGHSSSFTYGPWAQELMNRFYIEHLDMMPVDSPDYLDSASNPNLY